MRKKKLLMILGGIVLLIIYTPVLVIASITIYKNIILNPTPTPTPSISVPLDLSDVLDTFDDNKLKWLTGTDNNEFGSLTKTIAGGKYILRFISSQSMNLPITQTFTAAPNFTTSVDTKKVVGPSTADSGLIFNRLDANNLYRFSVNDSAKQYCLYLRYQGVWTALIPWTASTTIKTNETNNLKVKDVGGQISLYINGNKVNQVTNAVLYLNTDMGINMIVYQADQTVEFEFDNFKYQVNN